MIHYSKDNWLCSTNVIIKPNTAIIKLKSSIVKLCKEGRNTTNCDVLMTKWCIEYDTILLTIKWRLPSQYVMQTMYTKYSAVK